MERQLDLWDLYTPLCSLLAIIGVLWYRTNSLYGHVSRLTDRYWQLRDEIQAVHDTASKNTRDALTSYRRELDNHLTACHKDDPPKVWKDT